MKTATRGKFPVSYITARSGEVDFSHLQLRTAFSSAGSSRLSYYDETFRDRDAQGVLWARMTQRLDDEGLPTGPPLWRQVHPARQREAMLHLRCRFQGCKQTTRTPTGEYVFLQSTHGGVPTSSATVRTAQPPLCIPHALKAADRSNSGYVALLATSAPLYGVVGTRYTYTGGGGFQVLRGSDEPIPYGAAALDWVLASQLVRTLRAFTVIDLNDLEIPVPAAAAG